MIYETKNIYDQIFQFLRANGLCESKAVYSKEYLGRSRTYWNTIVKLNRCPSPEVIQTLIQSLNLVVVNETGLSAPTTSAIGEFITTIKDQSLHQKEVGYDSI